MRWGRSMEGIAVGSMRLRRGFLWAPKTIGWETRWLERARWWEEAQRSLRGYGDAVWVPPRDKWPVQWIPVKWARDEHGDD